MEFNVTSGHAEKQKTACLVVGVFEEKRLSASAKRIDKASNGAISQLLHTGDVKGKEGQTALLYNLPNIQADRVLVVGFGKERELSDHAYIKSTQKAIQKLLTTGAREATVTLTELFIKNRSAGWKVSQAVRTATASAYTFDQLKSKKETEHHLKHITFTVESRSELSSATEGLKQGQAIAAGVELTKTLGNLPGNICTPTYIAEQAKEMCKNQPNLQCTVLEEADIKKLNMNSFLSVTKGSAQPPKLIVIEYNAHLKDQKPIILVGKGITFDSGGISIKPGDSMDEMKYDMCGAATVLGTILAAKTLELPLHIMGIIPTCENMPSGTASKPGDIVTSMSGQTIEILNTDAEGRLILCDALTYSEQFKPDTVIDIATLTGACVVALGSHAHGLLSNTPALVKDLLEAGTDSLDRAWQLPLWEEYQAQLKSNFADMANIGGREGGTITAACFLARFTKKLKWAHLDIAGTAWVRGKHKGATGRPVPLLTHYLIERAKAH